MENLEDAVALFSPRGDLIFNNAAMRALAIPNLPASHPARQLVERTLAAAAHLHEAQKRVMDRVPSLDWAHRPVDQISPPTFRWS